MIDNIIKIKIGKKEYIIFLVRINLGNRFFLDYINAYTYLENIGKYANHFDNSMATLIRDHFVGVDTAHNYNENMTIDEKREDAIRQIKIVIKEYNKMVERGYKRDGKKRKD